MKTGIINADSQREKNPQAEDRPGKRTMAQALPKFG